MSDNAAPGPRPETQAGQPVPDDAPPSGGPYAHLVLGVLVIVYVFNFIDRNILSILAEDIKADLGVTDAQMGFLYGTAFAVFYAVFGIPLARFADVWVRRSLVSAGLLFWSAMTALTRAACIWAAAFPDPATAPFGLKGWHVAFMAVGVPGILLAGVVRLLREPMRGQSEGLMTPQHPAPFRVLGTELAAVIPPFTVCSVWRHGASLRLNLAAAVAVAAVSWLLIAGTGSVAQWAALGVAVYVTVSWAQGMAGRDRATFEMIFRSKALIYTTLAFPTIAFVTYGTGFWTAPFLMRVHGASASDVGLYVGVGNAIGGLIGVVSGGVLGDRLKAMCHLPKDEANRLERARALGGQVVTARRG